MSKKWMRLFLIIAILALNLVFSVRVADAQTTYATYVVQPGDTLGKIAAKYCTTWTVIYNLNRNVIYNPNVIYPGMVLTVPLNCGGNDGGGPVPGTCVDNGARLHASGTYSAPYYTVYWGDTLYSIGKRFGIPWQSIASANGLYYPTIYAGQRPTIPCGGSGTTPPPTPAAELTHPYQFRTREEYSLHGRDDQPGPADQLYPVGELLSTRSWSDGSGQRSTS